MARLELRLLIRATPERVWDVLSDLEHQKDWMADLHSLHITSPKRSGVGTEVAVTSKLFGLPLVKDRMVITAWEPPSPHPGALEVHEALGGPEAREARFDVKHVGSFSGTGAFILEAVPSGTVFTWIEDFKPPLGPLGELGFSLSVGPHLRRVFRRSMDNVRRLAEAGHEHPTAAADN